MADEHGPPPFELAKDPSPDIFASLRYRPLPQAGEVKAPRMSLRGAEGDEAIQGSGIKSLDCFASLAMTRTGPVGSQ
jgi:hypothetical protein